MKRAICLVLMGCLFSAVLAADGEARRILKTAESILYPDNFELVNTMTTSACGKGDVTLSFKVYHKHDTGTVMEITAPARSRGIRFLERSGSLWMYNPKAGSGNAVRLSAKSSFQGSVFSNSDMSDPDYSDDYATVIGGRETIEHPKLGSVPCIVLVCTAKDERAPCSKITMWVREADYLPLRIDYVARSGLLFKRMTLSGIRFIAGRVRPTVITMESFEVEGTVSTVTIEEMVERNDLSDSMFTEQALTR